MIMDYDFAGFPFKWFEGGGMCVGGPCKSTYNYFNLILDIIFLATVTLGINYLIEKIKNRK
jgi:hypothetical protein